MDKIEEYLNNKKVWVVNDNGWYYSVIEEVFETKEEAIKYWEKLTCKKYNEKVRKGWTLGETINANENIIEKLVELLVAEYE